MSDNSYFLSHSDDETLAIGAHLASHLNSLTKVIAIKGNVGAGKTTLIKGLISPFLENSLELVNSPTFTYLNIYNGALTFYHFDLYRLKDEKDFISLGFLDYLYGKEICYIEWPERIKALLPKQMLTIQIEMIEHNKRKILIL